MQADVAERQIFLSRVSHKRSYPDLDLIYLGGLQRARSIMANLFPSNLNSFTSLLYFVALFAMVT